MKARIIHADEATYMSGGASSEINFFMISDVLAGAVVSCEVVLGSPIKKHVLIVFRLRATCLTEKIMTIRKPPMFKYHNITSVAPEPVALLQEFKDKVSLTTGEDISNFYKQWAALAEDDLNSIHSFAAGVHRRGTELSYINVCHNIKGAMHPKCDAASTSLKHICACAQGYLTHHRNIFVARKFWIRDFKRHPRDAGDFGWAEVRRAVRIWPVLDDASIAEYIGKWAGMARQREDRTIRARVQSWTQWVDKAFSYKGGAKLFQYIMGSSSPRKAGMAELDINIAATEHAKPWLVVWKISEARYDVDELPQSGLPCPMLSIVQSRALANTYSATSAIGADHWQAKCSSRISDERISEVLFLMEAML